MRKLLIVCSAILCLSLTSAADDSPSSPDPSPQGAHAGFFAPERGRYELGINYQFQHFNELGNTFNDNGIDTSFNVHIVDPLTSFSWILTGSLEGAVSAGFGHTPILTVDSIFAGAGPRLAIESRSRLEPWVHLLGGLEHLRFTQTATLGGRSSFGFMLGGGVDYKITKGIYWRTQVDYLGAHFTPNPAIQSNVAVGTGLVINFY